MARDDGSRADVKLTVGVKPTTRLTKQDLLELNNQLQAENALLREISTTDERTGLLNERGIRQAFGRSVQLLQPDRQDNERRIEYTANIAWVLLDLDGFGEVNNKFSIEAGNEVLLAVANALKGLARSERDLVSRWGGDEFLMIFFGLTPEEAVQRCRTDERGNPRVIPVSLPLPCGSSASLSISYKGSTTNYVPGEPHGTTFARLALGLTEAKRNKGGFFIIPPPSPVP